MKCFNIHFYYLACIITQWGKLDRCYCLLFIWEKNSERYSDSPKVTQLLSDGLKTQIFCFPVQYSFHTLSISAHFPVDSHSLIHWYLTTFSLRFTPILWPICSRQDVDILPQFQLLRNLLSYHSWTCLWLPSSLCCLSCVPSVALGCFYFPIPMGWLSPQEQDTVLLSVSRTSPGTQYPQFLLGLKLFGEPQTTDCSQNSRKMT